MRLSPVATGRLHAACFAALTGAAFFAPADVMAGQLTFDERAPNGCELRFTGQVESGDLELFKDMLRHSPSQESEFYGGTLCLDSPGGSFPEALDIAELLLSEWKTIATKIQSGARCESACALIFLAGKTFEESETYAIWFDRSIEPGGKLGFHAPSLGLPPGTTYSSDHVTKGFNLALEAARRAFEMSLIKDNGDAVLHQYASPYVMARFLGTPPQDMYYINTVGDALLSGLSALGYSARARANEALIRTICDNVYMQSTEGFGAGFGARWKPTELADAKDVYRLFQDLKFKKDNGLTVTGPNGDREFSAARTHIESTGQRLIGYATGYPDYYIGEAACLVSLETHTQPGETIDHFEMTDHAGHVTYEFETGHALKVWLKQSFDAANDEEDILELLRREQLDPHDSMTFATQSPLVLFPWNMQLADLPGVGETAFQDSSALSCDGLWHRRNQIFHDNGYCFGGARGIAEFGNDGCYTKSPELTASEADAIRQIKQMEKDMGC